MKMRKAVLFLLLSVLLVSGMFLTGCAEEETQQIIPTTKQVEIVKHPVSKSFTLAEWNSASAASKTLTVELSESKPNTSYKWYSRTSPSSEGTLITNETGVSYAPVISSPGDYYYYVTVTIVTTENTNELVSGTARIRITDTAVPAPTSFAIGSTRVNYVRGVGGTGSFMFRDGNNADASPDADVHYIDLLMGEMGCNILRIMVQDDYLRYIQNEIQSRNQSVFYHNARSNFFAVIRRVNQLGGYVYANPWTAPGRFKANNAVRGGVITETPSNFVGYSDWLRDFLKWLNSNNAPIFALGILNEPDNGANAAYEGMGMTSAVHRDWFRTVGHFTTQRVTNPSGAGLTSSMFEDDIIPGYGGGKATHHVLAMTADNMGRPDYYTDIINSNSGTNPANNNFEILGHHWYNSTQRVTALAGSAGTAWADRPQASYTGRFESESLAMSPQMYAPGSTAGSIKREIWQTEHDFNYWSKSTEIPGSNVQRYWNSAFAAMNDVDWGLRVVHESVFDWWFSSSYSGLVTSYQGTPVNGNGQGQETGSVGATPWPAYTYTPRGRAFAHYARYVNETWLLDISLTRGTINFNTTTNYFNAGATDPKISAFEDTDGKFISIVMFTPNASTNTSNINSANSSGSIDASFGSGGTNGTNDPTRLSVNVGRIEVVLPDGFTAESASALRSYGWENANGQTWDDVPNGTPRYWINEPVFLYTTTEGKSAVEVTLPGGNIISIMVKGQWTNAGGRHFEPRKRPYTVK
ncbi:glycoside hydrolase [Treponema sp. R80B11-R83G3]